MTDPWLVKYNACARLGQEIMEGINDRNKNPKSSTVYAKKSATVRLSIGRFGQDLAQLRDDLIQSSIQYKVTQKEADRRQAMIDLLLTKQKQIDLAFQSNDQRSADRSSLMGGSSAFASDPWSSSGGAAAGNGGFLNEDMGIDQIRTHQSRIIEEQDRGLEALSRVIGRQKQIALVIGNEVEEQNEIIDDIADHTDQTNQRLVRETAHIKFVDKKSRTCCMYIVIVLLLIAIILVAAIPFS